MAETESAEEAVETGEEEKEEKKKKKKMEKGESAYMRLIPPCLRCVENEEVCVKKAGGKGTNCAECVRRKQKCEKQAAGNSKRRAESEELSDGVEDNTASVPAALYKIHDSVEDVRVDLTRGLNSVSTNANHVAHLLHHFTGVFEAKMDRIGDEAERIGDHLVALAHLTPGFEDFMTRQGYRKVEEQAEVGVDTSDLGADVEKEKSVDEQDAEMRDGPAESETQM